jgi:hypothetical protein
MKTVEPFIDATPLLDEPELLRRRASTDGFLFFSGLIDPERIFKLRREMLKTCRRYGWVKEGSEFMDGIAAPDIEMINFAPRAWGDFYNEILKLRSFHALSLEPNLLAACDRLFGEKTLPHSRNIARLSFPQNEDYATPPHQDHYYIGGSRRTWTAWIPCGHCPVALGGLAVAKGSHHLGFLDTHKATGAGGHAVETGRDWVWGGGDYRCGDVIICHSLAVHQAFPNTTGDQLRLSCDFRYQPVGDPVREDSLQPHMNWLTWEDVYESWPDNDPLKYYWKCEDLNIVKQVKGR